MCAIEAELEKQLGEFSIKMKGILPRLERQASALQSSSKCHITHPIVLAEILGLPLSALPT